LRENTSCEFKSSFFDSKNNFNYFYYCSFDGVGKNHLNYLENVDVELGIELNNQKENVNNIYSHLNFVPPFPSFFFVKKTSFPFESFASGDSIFQMFIQTSNKIYASSAQNTLLSQLLYSTYSSNKIPFQLLPFLVLTRSSPLFSLFRNPFNLFPFDYSTSYINQIIDTALFIHFRIPFHILTASSMVLHHYPPPSKEHLSSIIHSMDVFYNIYFLEKYFDLKNSNKEDNSISDIDKTVVFVTRSSASYITSCKNVSVSFTFSVPSSLVVSELFSVGDVYFDDIAEIIVADKDIQSSLKAISNKCCLNKKSFFYFHSFISKNSKYILTVKEEEDLLLNIKKDEIKKEKENFSLVLENWKNRNYWRIKTPETIITEQFGNDVVDYCNPDHVTLLSLEENLISEEAIDNKKNILSDFSYSSFFDFLNLKINQNVNYFSKNNNNIIKCNMLSSQFHPSLLFTSITSQAFSDFLPSLALSSKTLSLKHVIFFTVLLSHPYIIQENTSSKDKSTYSNVVPSITHVMYDMNRYSYILNLLIKNVLFSNVDNEHSLNIFSPKLSAFYVSPYIGSIDTLMPLLQFFSTISSLIKESPKFLKFIHECLLFLFKRQSFHLLLLLQWSVGFSFI
jgi:hypothetical protein